MNLKDLLTSPLWTPRAGFPASQEVGKRVFSCGEGFYLMTNPVMGDGDPVRAAGWAESDYWARRAWENPPFAGDLQAPPPQWEELPSLEFLGRPQRLAFQAVCAFERAKLKAPDPTLTAARYRFTDGAFLNLRVKGDGGNILYHYADTDPKPDDLPVAIEIGLPEHK